jgi:hypothetical protein
LDDILFINEVFIGEDESSSRIWPEPEKVPNVIHDHELAKMILNKALLTGEENVNVT